MQSSLCLLTLLVLLKWRSMMLSAAEVLQVREDPQLEAVALALVVVEAVVAAVAQSDSLDSQDLIHWLDLPHSLRTCSVSLSNILPAAARKDLDMLKFAAAL